MDMFQIIAEIVNRLLIFKNDVNVQAIRIASKSYSDPLFCYDCYQVAFQADILLTRHTHTVFPSRT